MSKIQIYELQSNNKILIPLASEKIPAGFPSPAQGYEEERLDITDIVVKNPIATYYVKVKGNSMIDANIFNGDILVVDKSIDARHNNIVIAVIDEEFTVKRLYKQNGIIKLVPENPDYPEIIIKDGQELKIWGVVSYIIHKAT